MKIGFVSKPECPKCVEVIKFLTNFLKENGHDYVIEYGTAKEMKMEGERVDKISADAIVTVGGDGAALWTLQKTKLPVLPVNVSSLAFLSEVDSTGALACINRLLRGDYRVEERARIKTTVNSKRLPDSLNEAFLKSMIMSKIRWFGVYLDNDFIHNIRADGIIIATPTGSTSYSLSVGGPILDPKVKGFIISYMAPFSLSARSMVVPSQSTIRIVALDKGKSIMLTLDGQEGIEVGFHDEISFTESEYPAKFIRFNSDFYKNAREKMG
ncbi:MAG: NAD(+)/NADH kinase [Thermoplasmatales archaeon]|jgi:NAD+ kinase|nr:NAD(+)/NADH kinase [Candidatus Thermoplasmatota archaeon]MCL6002470.1 NAD(+)/NADH kinase [Candidatus Thermoplasmatota archaeon]MDA8055221.1 NAD(+)/NADH kinase [Thermoplasmatales archaeon]